MHWAVCQITALHPDEYDSAAPAVLEDPASAHARLRAECPLHRSDVTDRHLYTLSRREDVLVVLTDPDTWSNRYGPGVGFSTNLGDLQRDDPPRHTSRRRSMRDRFLPRAVETLRPALRDIANDLLDEVEGRGRMDLAAEYALPLPVTGFIALMGIEGEHHTQIKEWADEMVLTMTYPDRGLDARRAMMEFAVRQVAERRAAADASHNDDPVGTVVPEGLLSELALGEVDGGRVAEEELANTISQLLVAGHETTTSLISNAVWRLLEEPNRYRRLVDEPNLVPNVVEESLRFDAPVLGLCKTNNRPVALHGETLPEDTKVMVLYASANRDAEVFENPDEFVLDRSLVEAKKHLSFGWGIHHCLGAHLARLTAGVGLATLIERLPGLRLDGEASRIEAPFLWGRRNLPVAWPDRSHRQ